MTRRSAGVHNLLAGRPLDGFPDLLLLVRRDGVLLGAAGGRGVPALQPKDTAIGERLEAVWPEPVARVIRQLVRQTLSSRQAQDALFRDDEIGYEVRVCAQGPDVATCTIREPSATANQDSAGTTGRFGAPVVSFERRGFMRRFQESLSMATLREQPTAVAVLHVEGIYELGRIIDTQVAELTMAAAIGRLIQPTGEESAEDFPWYTGQISESQIVLIMETRDRGRIEALIERHCVSLREPIRVGDADFHLTPYAGVAILGPDANSPRRLLGNARDAATQARRTGTGKACFFSDTVRLRSLARLDIASELRDAIAHRSIKLRYLARRDLATGALVAAVGQVHWRHPMRGEVPPGEFLAIAETTGLAAALSRSALEGIPADCAALRARGGLDIIVSFAPLRQHILDDGFLDDIKRLLATAPLRADRLELRIDERSLVACEAGLLNTVAGLGVRLIVEGIGRDVSSFDVLARAPLSGLQLDRRWIEDLPQDETALKLCRAGFALGAAYGLTCMAEGVDDPAQHEVLMALGCRYGVGDLFGEFNLARETEDRAAAG